MLRHARRSLGPTRQFLRHLNIHEYQSAQLMASKGVNVPYGIAAKSVDEAVAAAKKIGDEEVVIKSQILAGGRGLGTFTNGFKGGVHVIKTTQVAEYAGKMLGNRLVTKQSGPEGKPVDTLLLAKKMNLVNEMYFAIMLDRATMGPLIIACSEGGTSIEDLAHSSPEKIIKVKIRFTPPPTHPSPTLLPTHPNPTLLTTHPTQLYSPLIPPNSTPHSPHPTQPYPPPIPPNPTLPPTHPTPPNPTQPHPPIPSPPPLPQVPVDINVGITDAQADEVVAGLKTSGDKAAAREQIKSLYRLFAETDATMVEVNPLAEDPDGKLIAADAKIGFDDNAFFRQSDIFARRDETQEDQREVAAAKWDLNYVGLDGNVGCMVNGAGLAMATMDIINAYGAEPANFLDVGGSAKVEQITAAFKIITADPKVKAILVNIFGGIMKCDVIAEGVVKATKEVGLKIPLVVRLEGTNVDAGKDIINNSGLAITSADDLDDAAQKAVAAMKAAEA